MGHFQLTCLNFIVTTKLGVICLIKFHVMHMQYEFLPYCQAVKHIFKLYLPQICDVKMRLAGRLLSYST
jgi:hypothetical protein